jgi:hypothetical protein
MDFSIDDLKRIIDWYYTAENESLTDKKDEELVTRIEEHLKQQTV